jgi:endoglucanase
MVGAALSFVAFSPAATAAPSTSAEFNYAQALQDSMFFYESQRSGQLAPDNPVDWRGDSALSDGSDNGVNLTGGYYDAGDGVKFGLPEAYAMAMLAWGINDYKPGYSAAGQLQTALGNLRWGDDYILSAYVAPTTFYGQVGEGGTDHGYWGPDETNPVARPSYAITSSCAGSDLAGMAATALAASAVVFQGSDANYAAALLSGAEGLFNFANQYRGLYASCITDAQNFYNSFTAYWPELVGAAIWLYRATGTASYLTTAETDYANIPLQSQTTLHEYNWTVNWDDLSFADYVWMAELTGGAQYITDAEDNLNWWTTGFNGSEVAYSPGGEAFLNQWGSLRYSADEAFLALELSQYLTANNLSPSLATTYHNFAMQQLNYILGDNPNGESYEVGFTNNGKSTSWPQYPHSRRAHDSWLNNLSTPTQTRHLQYGLLVGGPTSANDQFQDVRSEYQYTEGALDYNALFSGDLAALVAQYGGTPLASFPPPETPDGPQIYVQAALNTAPGTNFVEVKALINNQSAWPPQNLPNANLRYYFTLDPGETASQVTLTSPYNMCEAPSGPFQYSGSTYYVEVNCSNLNIAPAGEDDYTNVDYQAQAQFRITFPGAHNAAADWSYQGIAAAGATPVTVADIALLAGNQLIWGQLPSTGAAPGAPANLTASVVTTTGATLSWAAPAAGANPVSYYQVSSSAGTPVGTTTGTSFTLSGLNPKRTTPYGFYVQAVDTNGMASPGSNIATFVTDQAATSGAAGALEQFVPPSPPSAPTVSGLSTTSATVSWRASTPGTSTSTSYNIYELAPGTGLVASTSSTSYALTGLTGATVYAYWVEAVDSSGHASQFSVPAVFFTAGPSGGGTTTTSPTTTMSTTTTTTAPTTTTRPATTTTAAPTTTTTAPTTTTRPATTTTTAPTTTTTTTTTTPTTASTTTTTAPPGACTASYAVTSQWTNGSSGPGGFNATVTVKAGSSALTGWTVTWTFANGQSVTSSYNAVVTQSGASVTAANESYNGDLAAGVSTSFGFQGSWSGTNSVPTLACT